MATLIDSYSESNKDANDDLSSGGNQYTGQSFACSTSGLILDSCKFYLAKTGSPTGNATAQLYSHTGTYGSTGTPDTLLATSGNYDVSALSTSFVLVTFTFSGANRVALTSGNKYFIVLNFSGGGGADRLQIGIDSSSPSHGGNWVQKTTGAWLAQSTLDGCFYVYGEAAAAGTSKDALLLGCG